MAGKKLLNNMDAGLQFESCEVSDFNRTDWNAGEKQVTEDAVQQWLQEDEHDPGSQVMTEWEREGERKKLWLAIKRTEKAMMTRRGRKGHQFAKSSCLN
jgi:hypothetical protein